MPISTSSLRVGTYGSGVSRIGASPAAATTHASAVSAITAAAVRTCQMRIARRAYWRLGARWDNVGRWWPEGDAGAGAGDARGRVRDGRRDRDGDRRRRARGCAARRATPAAATGSTPGQVAPEPAAAHRADRRT